MEVFSVPVLVALAFAAFFSSCQAGGIDMNADGSGVRARAQAAKDVVWKITGCAPESATCQNTDRFEGQIIDWTMQKGKGTTTAEKNQLWAYVWFHVKKISTKGLADMDTNARQDTVNFESHFNPTIAAASKSDLNGKPLQDHEDKHVMARTFLKVTDGKLVYGTFSDPIAQLAGNGWAAPDKVYVDGGIAKDWDFSTQGRIEGLSHKAWKDGLSKMDDIIAKKLNALWANACCDNKILANKAFNGMDMGDV